MNFKKTEKSCRLVKCYDSKKEIFEYCIKIGEGKDFLIYKRVIES